MLSSRLGLTGPDILEASCCEDAGYAREHTGLVLDETVEDMAYERLGRGRRSCASMSFSSFAKATPSSLLLQ